MEKKEKNNFASFISLNLIFLGWCFLQTDDDSSLRRLTYFQQDKNGN
jgi:hypothetical protein